MNFEYSKKAQKMILQEQYKKFETVLETKVYHQIRKKFNLSINDYCVVDLIYSYSVQTDSNFPNWCYKDIIFFVKSLGISRATVYNIIKNLIDKELVIRDTENSFLRTTEKFNQEIKYYGN